MTEIAFYPGRPVDLFNLKPEDIEVSGVAHSLANLNRFNGHTRFPYSVAQHTIYLSRIVPPRLAKAAFLHDWSEAYVGDMVAPLKDLFSEFWIYETHIQKLIFDRYDVPFCQLEEVDEYDKALGWEEYYQLFEPSYGLTNFVIEEWHWTEAKAWFHERYKELF
jgi:uncharacterized protein